MLLPEPERNEGNASLELAGGLAVPALHAKPWCAETRDAKDNE